MENPQFSKVPSSFRDPSGFVFKKDGIFFRQVNEIYRDNYDLLVASGLYKKLAESGFIIKHKEVDFFDLKKPAYKILAPEQIPFISYPYEWCFTELKEAALLTLKIQKLALQNGMSLKDASAYNIQFAKGKPIFIDTLSFERYQENKPWVAYRQFCQHFLAPLALISRLDLWFGRLSQNYLDGIPLDLAASLLPFKTRFSLGLAVHIHLHARSQKKYSDTASGQKNRHFNLSKNRLFGILESLEATVNTLSLPRQATEWGDYYNDTNYTSRAFVDKQEIIERWLDGLKPKTVWDAGANDASFSRLASKRKIITVATDIDPLAIENAYSRAWREKDEYLLPLIMDFVSPSPAIGWVNKERDSFLDRGHFDLSLCLAFIHHLAIANNLPFAAIAELFGRQSRDLIIEFVPKNDSNCQRLLLNREDIFTGYNRENFEKEFSRYYAIKQKESVKESGRTLYLMRRK